MRILSHYFIGRFLGLFAMVLAVAFLILATIELVLNLDDVAAFGSASDSGSVVDAPRTLDSPTIAQAGHAVDVPPSRDAQASAAGDAGALLAPFANSLRYLALRLTSYYLTDLLPIASFVAVFLVFALSGRALERLAIETGGIRPFRIVLPVMAAALILSLGAAVLHETLILHARQIWSGERHAGRSPIEFGRDAFWLHEGPTITNVARADPETRTLHDVEIFERDAAGRVQRVIRGERVRIDPDGLWRIENALVWRFDPGDARADPIFEARDLFALDIDAPHGDRLLAADPSLLSLRDLSRYLDGTADQSSSTLRRSRSQYHERASRPWLVLLFAWMAVPFAMWVDQRGRIAGPAVAAVAALGLYFLAESAGRTLTQQGLIPVGLMPWLLMAAAAALATIGARRSARVH